MKRFWQWVRDEMNPDERILRLEGAIAEESWLDDEVTPAAFKSDLMSGNGPVTVWINSPGGDCIAAAQIYNMLVEYPADVTVRIDGIAASAASVIAMAGTKVCMSPVSMMMIHNPLTVAMGDTEDMRKAIQLLDEVKESIINAYEIKTGLSRAKISHLMDAETWMSAEKAQHLGFCDEITHRKEKPDEDGENPAEDPDETDPDEEKKPGKKPYFGGNFSYSRTLTNAVLLNKLITKFREDKPRVNAADLEHRLSLLNH